MAKTSKPVTRKAQAKKANAPMKNAPKEKSPKAAVKASASKAAKTMAKTVKPEIRKSAAKRVEKVEKKAAGYPEYKAQLNKLIKGLRDDSAAVAEGKGNEQHFCDLVRAISRTIFNTKKKQGYSFE